MSKLKWSKHTGWKKYSGIYLLLLLLTLFTIHVFEGPVTSEENVNVKFKFTQLADLTGNTTTIRSENTFRRDPKSSTVSLLLPGDEKTKAELPDHSFEASDGYTNQSVHKLQLSDVKLENTTAAMSASLEPIDEYQNPFTKVISRKFRGRSLYLLMFIIIVGTLISEDFTCIGAGLLAARGMIGFLPATLACLIGIFLGDIGLYAIGRTMGRSAIRYAPFKWFISEGDLKKSAQWFNNSGSAIVFITRFLPGSRLPTYFTAGVIRANFWMFATYFLLAALVWSPLLVGLSMILGNQLVHYFTIYKNYALWSFIAALFTIAIILKIVIPLFNYKGRRFLLARYRRLTRWEYWSPVILYLPVTLYVIYLGIKYRCMTLFTAVNPGISHGGFVGESKTNILHLFNNDEFVAEFDCIKSSMEPEEKIEKAHRFMKEHQLSFPIVLKPDIGQRCKGVSIIYDENQMREYLSRSNENVIIQEYIPGKEFGIFYYRHPDEPKGNIYSITRKNFVSIEGDGQKTIEELILEDDRTLNLAKYHLENNEERLYDVPAAGEKVCIAELGSHACGAIFEDGHKHITQELVDKMNEISCSAGGFYFGRYDIKVPSPSALAEGRSLKVIEVNGVTSESTNMYDSKYSFWDAQKILMKQWKLAFEIGKINRDRGAKVTPVFPLLKQTFTTLG